MCWNMRGSSGKAIPAVLPPKPARVICEGRVHLPSALDQVAGDRASHEAEPDDSDNLVDGYLRTRRAAISQ
jgi:hypothetical protein